MSDALSVLFASILADPTLRPAFQELCRTGHVLAEGRQVRFVGSESEKGRLEITPVVEPKYEPIPARDWKDLSLHGWEGEWRLQGDLKWFSPELGYEPREWRFLRFRPGDDLLKLTRLKPRAPGRPRDSLNLAMKLLSEIDIKDVERLGAKALSNLCDEMLREQGDKLKISVDTVRRAKKELTHNAK